MTVSDLYKSVAQLGFESALESEEHFYFSLNRALLQVNAIRPATRTYIINHNPLENMIKESTFSPIEVKGDSVYFEADGGKAYYFEADGEGTCEIQMLVENKWEAYGGAIALKNKGFKAYYGFIKDGNAFVKCPIRLEFYGDYVYSLRNVAVYEYVYSGDKNDIPAFTPFSRYDISALTNDFLSLAAPPIEKDGFGYLDKGYDVENGRVILLPREAKGLYKVIYNHKPLAISPKSNPHEDKTDIDIDEELAALLPLLVASYVWVEDEPEKAQYYAALYRENALSIERRHRSYAPSEYQSINGW